MTDKQIREALGRINKETKELFRLYDRMKDLAGLGNQRAIVTKVDFERKCVYYLPGIFRDLAERQAALEEITRLKRRYAVGQTTGERAREIACRFTGGE